MKKPCLYNKGFRSSLLRFVTDIEWFDQQVHAIHHLDRSRNVPWQEAMSRDRFRSLLRILTMDLNLKQGISNHPARLIGEKQTCFTCSIAINSPVKRWKDLRQFRLSLLNSGFFGVDSEKLERVTHQVKRRFGSLVYDKGDNRWKEVLEIANQIASRNS